MRYVNPIIYYTVYVQGITAGVSLIPGAYGISIGESVGVILLFYGIAVGLIVTVFRLLTHPSRPLRLDDAILVAVSSWLLVPLLAAVPVSLALDIPFIDAWFEAVSGFTTTGLSMFSGTIDQDFGVYIPSVEELPRCIQLWRSLIQWIGGLGILVILVALAMGGGLPPHIIGLAEGRYERLEPSLARSLRRLLLVYTTLTIISTILFHLFGMPLFDAVNHAMTALATGGFSVHQESIGYYNNPLLELIVVIAMILGAMNFATHYHILFRGKLSALVNDPELKLFIGLVIIGASLSSYILYVSGLDLVNSLRHGLFQYVTALTGTGFQTISLADAPDELKFILAVACLIGGSYLSTTGGIKLYRLLIVLMSIKWTTRAMSSIRGTIVIYRIGNRPINLLDIIQGISVLACFTILWILGTILTLLFMPQTRLSDAALEAASALGTVGVSSGITGAHIPLQLKLTYICLMTLGRLEVLPYITAIRILIHRHR